jgi:hypothetical protein
MIPQENNELIFVSASKRSNGISIKSPEKTEIAMSKKINLAKAVLQISSQKKIKIRYVSTALLFFDENYLLRLS